MKCWECYEADPTPKDEDCKHIESVITRRAGVEMEKLSVKKGDVVLFTGDITYSQWRQFGTYLNKALDEIHGHGHGILLIHAGVKGELKVEKLDEKHMKRYGWVRAQ